ncbi:hypothetical protein SAMN05428941_0301 [Streptomyces sp. 2114.2]|uniref:Uncharacterized protein n=1 Tax=Streptomyces lividans TK24 TaxID=457428 RepID=A0ABN4E7C4_STRLI|nr:hypothetical protein SLIV_36690 [Streptomyces lividans TK24]PSK61109.1 hypothetical protein B0E38_00070 [Streptomyces sp. 111WW2]QSJ13833.1 hypothetical protein SLIVDG2_36690 [Streptomyces lividans]REH18580.1 hypothetical protein BX268_0299 [Streptomyces sp. 2221.1]SDS33834.1 hypothetical protein SAMN05428941_0301 [Streptomyces sp. 2114.2]
MRSLARLGGRLSVTELGVPELLRETETAYVLGMREYVGKPFVPVRSSTLGVRRPNGPT